MSSSPSIPIPQSCPLSSDDLPTPPPPPASQLPDANISDQDSTDEDDQLPCDTDRLYSGVFEGPEKTLEVCFRKRDGTADDVKIPPYARPDPDSPTPSSSPSLGPFKVPIGPAESVLPGLNELNLGTRVGLRTLPLPVLQTICTRAKCTIISSMSNDHLDAYVLSESSLFVYPYMLVLKTCGTTTLLRCIKVLIEQAHKIGLVLDWIGYSRKNFLFPDDQLFPHTSFHQEINYINRHKHLSHSLAGNGYTLGPVTNDHWFVWVADRTNRMNSQIDTDRVINIMMFDIEQSVSAKFNFDVYEKEGDKDSTGAITTDASRRISMAMTKSAGIDQLVPGATIDPRAFEPCGYSMNAILYNSYSTMHVTPEENCSYASFETNQKLQSYHSLINNVVRTFKPKRFILTMMADEAGLNQIKDNPLEGRMHKPINVPVSKDNIMSYRRSSLASVQIEDDTCCLMGTFMLEDGMENATDFRREAGVVRGMSYT